MKLEIKIFRHTELFHIKNPSTLLTINVPQAMVHLLISPKCAYKYNNLSLKMYFMIVIEHHIL